MKTQSSFPCHFNKMKLVKSVSESVLSCIENEKYLPLGCRPDLAEFQFLHVTR